MNNRENEDVRREIKINKKMRAWNKYRNYCFIAASVLIVIIVLLVAVKVITRDKGNENNTVAQQTTGSDNKEQTTVASQQSTTASETQQSTQTQQTTQQPTTAAQQTVGPLKVGGTAEIQDFVGAEKFDNCVFVGDSIISGISFYGYLPSSQVVSDDNLTSDKLKDQIDSALSSNPSKLFIMVGLNDANYGTRDGETIGEYIGEAVKAVKAASASTNVYILSVLPVTSAFENRSNVRVKQSVLDDLNAYLSANAASFGAVFIDFADAYKDSSGYLMTDCTGNGSNIYNGYYPFMLNSINKALNK